MDGERLDSGFVIVANAYGQPDGGVGHQACKTRLKSRVY